MLILALVVVFTGDATAETGPEFAWIYLAYLVVLTWLWYSVRRVDSRILARGSHRGVAQRSTETMTETSSRRWWPAAGSYL